MTKQIFWLYFLALTFFTLALPLGAVVTDSLDIIALEDLYSALNSPRQLNGWKSRGGDPCIQSWQGISCSDTSVIFIEIHGLGLNGTLGYQLSHLLNLKSLDASNNYIHGEIPYPLPPNITHLNLAFNNFRENLPYSIAEMRNLNYLNLSHNNLNGLIVNLFKGLHNLTTLDLSFNNLSGDLPSTFTSLNGLTTLYLQNNQLTGSVNVLASLPLSDLNIENNHFSGWIPQQFDTIENCQIEGNMFETAVRYPPPYLPPRSINEPTDQNVNQSHTPKSSGYKTFPLYPQHKINWKELSPGVIAAIIAGGTLGLISISLVFVFHFNFHFHFHCPPRGQIEEEESITGGSSGCVQMALTEGSAESPSQCATESDRTINMEDTIIHTPPCAYNYSRTKKIPGIKIGARRGRTPLTATLYTLADLQIATSNFSKENFLGKGSIGSVYRASFPNGDGQIFAVKKVDVLAMSSLGEELFLDVVWDMSILRHPNIISLLGYCVEFGQHLLVYEYVGNGTLHDALHGINNTLLTWNARMKIALGAARALEYLHGSASTIHKNFKASNILLNDDFMPRLSDSGLAILTRSLWSQESSHVAPESGICNTEKIDVYSFGVMLLELLTGRKPVDRSRARRERDLVRWAWPRLHDIDALCKMVDPDLKGTYTSKSLSRLADTISMCIQPDPAFRPPMSHVIEMLPQMCNCPLDVTDIDVLNTDIGVSEISFHTAHTAFDCSEASTSSPFSS